MYCAVLNQTRMGGLRRTNVSTTTSAAAAISMGTGWGNNRTAANSGTNTTELETLAKAPRRCHASLSIAVSAKTATSFHRRGGGGSCHRDAPHKESTPADSAVAWE